MRELADTEGLIPARPTIFRNILLHGQFQMPQTYGLTTTPLPEKFRQNGVFGNRVWCGRDVQFCARIRIRTLLRCISAMQSLAACWSVCLSRIASSYRMLRAVATPIACTWSANTLLGTSFSANSLAMTRCSVSMSGSSARRHGLGAASASGTWGGYAETGGSGSVPGAWGQGGRLPLWPRAALRS